MAAITKPLTVRQQQAALLVALDQMTDVDIAKQVGITDRQLLRWKQSSLFVSRVEDLKAAFARSIQARGIADRQNRVDALNERWLLMQRVIDERARHPEYAAAPGGTTGLLVKSVKAVGQGKDIEIIDEYGVDVALLRELRAHEQQAAQELGQWTEKRELSTKDNKPLTVMVIRGVSMDEL